MEIAQAIVEAAFILRKAGVEEARREAGSLLAHTLGQDRSFLITHADEILADSELASFREFVMRRAAGEPRQYITGHQEFFGLDLEVTPDVLIPRPETELLVETALKLLPRTREPLICDVGTGSGCIAIALLYQRADARAVGLDISPAALRVAARNAARHGVGERLTLVESDIFAALDPSSARFTMIVSNPPYVAGRDFEGLQREVRDYEPRVALMPAGSAAANGLEVILRLLADAPQFLDPQGHLIFEIGFNQHEVVRELIDPRVWTLLDIQKDLQGIDRTVVLRKNENSSN